MLALTGVLVGVAGAASSLVQLRANRLVPGIAEPITIAGPFAWLIMLALAAGMLAAVAPWVVVRRGAALLAAPLLLASTAWGVGRAAHDLLAGEPAIARVSLSTGAWVMVAAVGVLALAAKHLEPPADAARRLLLLLGGVVAVAAFRWGGLSALSLAREFSVRSSGFWPLVGGHLALSMASLFAGVVIGIPLGLWASGNRRAGNVVLGVAGAIQTVPSLALLGLLVVPLAALATKLPLLGSLGIGGIGSAPGFIVLALYALLPIVRGTYVGLSRVDPGAVDAGLGMGMSRRQLLLRVKFPLAVPLIVDGIRTAAVLVVGIATLTALAGARNLGVLVFEGLGQFAPDLILLGALPIIVLAITVDVGFGRLSRMLTPKGVRV